MGNEATFITKNFGKYDPMSIDSYLSIGGYSALKRAISMDGEDIASKIAEAKVKGRGGAAYDMGRKWSQSRGVKAPHKVVICNADEGETCTFKDRDRILNAIKQAEEKGFLGDRILGTDFSFRIHLYSGAGAYVCGEGTALIRSIEGKAGRPRMKPPFMKVSGLFALPTCVNNVESFAIVPHLLMDDKREYVSYGSGESLGTKLICLGGNVRRPGVYEIPFGTTVRDIIFDLGQGIPGGHSLRLIQFGGASGKVADSRILDTPYTYDDLKKAGVTVGSGSVLVIDDRTSVLDFLRMTQDFFSEESCGQCTPCREGNLHIKLILAKMARGEATQADIREMKKIASIMSISSLCGLGESAQNALLSAMKVFPETFELGGEN